MDRYGQVFLAVMADCRSLVGAGMVAALPLPLRQDHARCGAWRDLSDAPPPGVRYPPDGGQIQVAPQPIVHRRRAAGWWTRRPASHAPFARA